MQIHKVSLNGKEIVVAGGYYRLLTMLLSVAGHDADGLPVASSELFVEGVDATGREATSLLPSTRLKEGDVVQIVIGRASHPGRTA